VKAVQEDEQACFTYKTQGELFWVCSVEPVREVLHSRQLMMKIHALCMNAKLEIGEVTAEQLDALITQKPAPASAAKKVASGGAKVRQTAPEPAGPGEYVDKMLISDPGNGVWVGNVHWMQLGQTLTDSEPLSGLFSMEDRYISLSDDSFKHPRIELNLLNMFNVCHGLEPCMLDQYLMAMSIELSTLEFETLKKVLEKFHSSHGIIKKDSCTIISFLEPYILFREDYVVCTRMVKEGASFRTALATGHKIEYTNISPADPEFLTEIPNIPTDNKFDVHLVLTKLEDSAPITIHFDDYKIWVTSPGDILVKYSQIDHAAGECSINLAPQRLSDLDNVSGLDESVDRQCCWSYFVLQKQITICSAQAANCLMQKVQMVRFTSKWCALRLKGGDDDSGLGVEELFNYGVQRNELFNSVATNNKYPVGYASAD